MQLKKPQEDMDEHSDFSDRLQEEYFGRFVGFIALRDRFISEQNIPH
jgi:hypothetical protein